jgi:hypothetical protein
MGIPFFKKRVLESKHIQGPVVKYARNKGLVAIKTSGPGNRSFMDFTFFMEGGITFFIEFKAPGKEPTANQRAKHKEMREKGFSVFWTDSVKEGKALIDLFL